MTSSTAFLNTEKLKQNKKAAISCHYGSPEEGMPATVRKRQRYYTANKDNCCVEKLFPERLPRDVTWQWGIICFHRTSSHCRAATGGITGTDIPQGYSTLLYDQEPSCWPSFEWTTSPQQGDQPALPVLHHQNKDTTFLAHRRKEGSMQFKEVKPWQCWALWCQKSHRFVFLVLMMVPSTGMAWISTSSCIWDTQKPNLCELWTAVLTSRWFTQLLELKMSLLLTHSSAEHTRKTGKGWIKKVCMISMSHSSI